ncbi:hypothetical protein Rhal01_02239 [Rubritalea halochordaticola]|uniref:Ice-binding protein C-terminal domain-containing protein n=1 Tax=Rubritalea halochordaticola TaxID=714537 RepID=A0ABP9V042_9BACT
MKHKLLFSSLTIASTMTLTANAATTAVWQGGDGNYFGDANWTVNGTPDQVHAAFSTDAFTSSVSDGILTFSSFTLGSNDTLSLTGTSGLTGNFITSGGTANHFQFSSSAVLTLNNANPLRSGVGFNGNFNWALGTTGTVVHTDLSNSGSHLARKVNQGFFAINGTKVNTVTTYDGTNLTALNTDLKDNHTVDGYYFEITEAGGQQTLSLVAAVPEPSSTALIGLAGLGFILRRRK